MNPIHCETYLSIGGDLYCADCAARLSPGDWKHECRQQRIANKRAHKALERQDKGRGAALPPSNKERS